MNPTQARRKILNWKEPYRSGALSNIRDAESDLMKFPDFRKEILRDMTEAIKTWEDIIEVAKIVDELHDLEQKEKRIFIL